MKSRKPAKCSPKAKHADQNRKTLRSRLRNFETLEDRRLLAVAPWSDGKYYPPLGLATALLPKSISYEEYASISSQQFGGASAGNTGLHGEGTQGFASVSESEPNNVLTQAQFVNLGTGNSQNNGISVIGSLRVPALPGALPDEDYYAFDLKAGDIFDARIDAQIGIVFDFSVLDSNRREVVGTTQSTSASGAYPVPESPLTQANANLDVAFVAPADGRYYARVSDGDVAYTLTMRVRRPALEAEPLGTKQILFLDFDGEFVRRSIFDATIPGTARLSPLVDFLPSWGLTAADENRVIDGIVEIVTNKFVGANALPSNGGNGYFAATGIPGQFDIEIRNSRDHADPFGQPNVSRVIIGGSISELLITTIGIAESIDIGNFDTEETAVTLLDSIVTDFLPLPRAGNVSAEDIVIDAIASVTVHEAGHLFGAWHTLNTNALPQLMDTGGNPANLLGVGPDGIYGTLDDIDVQFGTDTLDPDPIFGSPVPFGRQNSAALIAWGLSTGTVGGSTINGSVYNDRNLSRTLDAGDTAAPSGAMVWADNNFDGVYNVGEYFGFSRANGTYSLVVPAGTHNVRVGPHLGWTTTTAVNRSITIGSGATLNGINFGVQVIDQSITGLKWNDLNGDGQRDANEPAIPGVWIYIDLDGDNRIDIGEPSSQTDKDGKYKLTFPGTGQFTIREVAGPGYVQTFPGTAVDNEHTIVLTGNPSIDGPLSSNLNFGNRLTIDFGDAPQSYGSASHGFVEGLVLGSLWDAEQSSNFSNNADGDDSNNLDDEDGIAQGSPFVVGRSDNQLVVTAINTTDQPAYLQAWADFDGDGVFAADERIVTNAVVGSFPVTSVPFRIQTLQEGAKLGNTVFRFRYGLEQNTPATGIAASGEVEDYIFSVVETLDLAVPDQAQFPRNSVLNPIDVLANDFSLPGETLQVVGVSPTLQLSQVTSSTTSQGGTVTISSNNTVLYTPKNGFIGTDVFSYTMENGAGQQDFAQVTITVNLSFDEPRAIDDSFEAATNSVDFPLNVLANDIEGAAGALTIIAVTQPDKGSSVSIATGGKSLRYTPRRDLGDTEFFTYTVADASGNRSTANVTIHTLPGARDLDLVQIRLVATDLNGNEISSVAQGSPFKLDVYVDDLRSSPPPATGAAAGVFAAYADILYNLQLVSTVSATTGTSSLPFDASFFNGYLNGVSGDAAIPGVIDEFGAFFDGSTMNRPGETRLASITFEARSPGIARFMPDPADDFPDSDVLLFDTSSTAIPLERVRYLGTSIAVVGDGVEFPAALDDSFTGLVQANAAQVPLPVLANDRIGTSGPLTIESVTSGVQGGTTSINGGNIRYTPQPGFNGTDQFTYTIQDTRGIQSTATVTVHVGNSTANDFVRYDLEVTDLNGQSITSIPVGSQFQLRAYVDDLRAAGSGIFAAYQDVLYSASLVSPVASSTNDPNLGFQVQFGPNYQRVRDGDNLIPGVINEIGAVATTDTAHGNDRKLLFTVTMTANSVGTANFASDPADIVPLHDTIPFVPTAPFNLQQIGYGFDSLQIVPSGSGSGSGEGFTNANNPLDVNDDGFVSPIDVLVVINSLNDTGSRSLVSSGGEGESSRFYIDTNADGHLSPIDVLLVINYLNDNTRGAGEGEGSDGLSAWATPPLTEDSDTDGENSDVSEQGGTLLLSQNSALTGTQSNEHAELFAAATDELFDVQSDDSLDDLLEQLAPDIEDRWKKQFVF